IQRIEPHCAGLHLDVMDNHFVPNLTWGPLVINPIARAAHKKVWVHLMVDKPLALLEVLTLPAGTIVTFHSETKENKQHILDHIHKKNYRASIAINPQTDISEIFPWLGQMYQVLIMSVAPGFAGQPFLKKTINKI